MDGRFFPLLVVVLICIEYLNVHCLKRGHKSAVRELELTSQGKGLLQLLGSVPVKESHRSLSSSLVAHS